MLRLLIIALGTYAILVLIMYLAQRHFTYFPDRTRYDPASVGLPDFEEIQIETADGLSLIAWYKAAAEGRPTILLFQGNAGNIANRNFKARAFADRGYGMLMPNYRGYGGSDGSPSEAGLQEDGRAAVRYLADAGVPPEEIVLYGESLGSGVSVALAESIDVAALVLEAPYTSLPDVASSAYPWLPVRFLMKDRFASIESIGKVKAPLLVVHGSEDEVIPVALGQELFEAANEPKRLVIISGAHHNDIFDLGSGAAIFDFLEKTFPRD
jgi:fermentation-respiration switch protein FrsA (DUF1100 family)